MFQPDLALCSSFSSTSCISEGPADNTPFNHNYMNLLPQKLLIMWLGISLLRDSSPLYSNLSWAGGSHHHSSARSLFPFLLP